MNKKAIKIQDTTLRDGEQTPGIAFNLNEKVKILNILEKIGVDCIEVGFPGASTEEENIIKNICKNIKKNKTTICVFSRILESDIRSAAKVTENIENVKIQLVAPVSDLQISRMFSYTTTCPHFWKPLPLSLMVKGTQHGGFGLMFYTTCTILMWANS